MMVLEHVRIVKVFTMCYVILEVVIYNGRSKVDGVVA